MPGDSNSRRSEPVVTERPVELTCEDVSLPSSAPVAMNATSGAGGRIENTDLPLSENSLKDQSEPRARGDCFTDLFWLPSVEIDPHRVALGTPAPDTEMVPALLPSAAMVTPPRAAPPPAGDYGDLFAEVILPPEAEPAAKAPEPEPAPPPAAPVRGPWTSDELAAIGNRIIAEVAAMPLPDSSYTPPPPEVQLANRLAAIGARMVIPAMAVTPAGADPGIDTLSEVANAAGAGHGASAGAAGNGAVAR